MASFATDELQSTLQHRTSVSKWLFLHFLILNLILSFIVFSVQNHNIQHFVHFRHISYTTASKTKSILKILKKYTQINIHMQNKHLIQIM